jgi:hypothetical protein
MMALRRAALFHRVDQTMDSANIAGCDQQSFTDIRRTNRLADETSADADLSLTAMGGDYRMKRSGHRPVEQVQCCRVVGASCGARQ